VTTPIVPADHVIIAELRQGSRSRRDLVLATGQKDRFVRARIRSLQCRGHHIVSEGNRYTLNTLPPEELEKKANTLTKHAKSAMKTASRYRQWARNAANPEIEGMMI
jgi:thiamine kinase-like enzyme